MNHSNDEEYIEIEVNSYYYFSSSSSNSSSSQITKNNSQFFEDLEDSFCINLLITPISSPSQTSMVSFELNPNDHKIISPKKLWSKFMIKPSLINQKFKASRAFLKSLFSKSSCTNSNCCSSKDMKISKKKTSNNEGLSSRWQYSSINGESFSSSTSNSSFNSINGFTSEDSIEAAVAHCKKSQQCGWSYYKDINN